MYWKKLVKSKNLAQTQVAKISWNQLHYFFFLSFLEHYAGATTETTEANANLPAEVENKKEGGQNGQHHGEQLIPVSPKSFLTFFSVWLVNQMMC